MIFMLYFFYGADSFRLNQKIKSVIDAYQTKHQSGLNFSRFDLSQDEEFAKMKNFWSAFSMFTEKKLLVVENLFETAKHTREKFSDFISQPEIPKDKERFLVVSQNLRLNEEKKTKEKYVIGDKVNQFLLKKLTSQPAEREEFELLKGAQLERWIKKEVEKSGGKIDGQAIKKLAVFVGADLWQMKNEVDKLISFKIGKLILAEDVDNLVRARIESDIFKTIDALANRQKMTAFKFLRQHLERGESEVYLLSMLVYQFRNLLLVKDQIERGTPFYDLSKKLKLHPFVLRKSFEQSKNFSLGALKKIYSRLAENDLKIKSGLIEPRVALDLIVQEIAS